MGDKTFGSHRDTRKGILFDAVHSRYTHCIKPLIDAGEDINWQDKNGYTALHIAVLIDYMDGVQTLLEAKIDGNLLNTRKYSALDIAIYNKNITCVKLLLRYNSVDPSYTTNDAPINTWRYAATIYDGNVCMTA